MSSRQKPKLPDEEAKEEILPYIRHKVEPPPPVYQTIPGLDDAITKQVPLEHRRQPADIFAFPDQGKDERDPTDPEVIRQEAFAKNDFVDEFSTGFLLGFLFSWAQQRIQQHSDFVRVYTWNPNPLIRFHHEKKIRFTNQKAFIKANKFGLAFGFFSALMGFWEPIYNRWWGDRGFVPTGMAGGSTSVTLALYPTLRNCTQSPFRMSSMIRFFLASKGY